MASVKLVPFPSRSESSAAVSTLDQLSGEARAAVEAKIRELYTEDVTFYEWNRRLRNRDGSAPDGVGCT